MRNQEKRLWKLRCLRVVCLLKASAAQDPDETSQVADEMALKLMRASMSRNWEAQRDYWLPFIEQVEASHNAVTKESK